MRLLTGVLRGRRRELGTILALSAIEAVPVAVAGEFVALGLDHGFLQRRSGTGFLWLSALLGAIVLGAVAARLTRRRLSTVVTGVVDELTRTVVGTALHSAGGGPGGVALVEQAQQHIAALLRTVRRAAIAIVATVVGVIVLAPILAVFVVPALFVALVGFGFLLPALIERERAVVAADDALTRDVTGLVHGLRDVVACQATDRAAADTAAVVDRQAAASRSAARISALRVAIVAVGAQVPLLVLLGLGTSLVHSGRLSVGELLAAAGYLFVVVQPALRSLVQPAGEAIVRLAAVLPRIAENAVPPAESSPGTATPPGYPLSVSNLTFCYGPDADPVLRDLDLTLAEGEHLAVVGPPGSGKSTLADLVCGLIRPQRGEIRLDGVELHSWDPAALHSRVTLAARDPYIFDGTIGENVGYRNPAADLTAAADAVELWPLLDRLGGWDAVVRPVSLSAADRQLIGLARAYAGPARLVVLDQAGCHLDPRLQQFVEESFRDRAGSLIVIPHRIESARAADRILVLDGPGGAVYGRHDELLDTSPLYARLVGRPEPALATGDQSAL